MLHRILVLQEDDIYDLSNIIAFENYFPSGLEMLWKAKWYKPQA